MPRSRSESGGINPMGETSTLRSDDYRSGPPGAEDGLWAGKAFLGLGEVKTHESSHWTCPTCQQAGKGIAQFDRLAAEEHSHDERHLVIHAITTAFIPAERYEGP